MLVACFSITGLIPAASQLPYKAKRSVHVPCRSQGPRSGPRRQADATKQSSFPGTELDCFGSARNDEPFSRRDQRASLRATMSNSNVISSSPPGLTRWSMLTCGLRMPTGKSDRSFASAWIAGSSPAMTKGRNETKKIRKRNADRRSVSCPHQRVRFAPRECRLAPTLRCGRARLSAFHHGSALGSIHPQGAASGHASWDVAERRSCSRPLPGAEPTQFVRALPAPHLSQSSEHLAAQSVVLGWLMPEAARERSASPPAGTALAPTFGMPPEGVLASEIRFAAGL